MIAANAETFSIWNALPANDRSRALAADRFVDFPNNAQDNDWRRRTSEAVLKGKADPAKVRAWSAFIQALGALELHANLQSRLMVNMASGVFENGNLSLDRNSGIPYIPGSALKGCARRFAIHALSEAPADQKKNLLGEIATILGWGVQDWKSGRNRNDEFFSDFELACGTQWETCKSAFKDLPSQSSGRVAFLPAYPVDGDPGIELDVLTGHHKGYYEGTLPTAIDTEEPTPVIFPAVSAARKPRFLFAILPLRPDDQLLAEKARDWLQHGLEGFGIGAKTAAGYGWFKSLDQADVDAKRAQDQRAASDYATDQVFQNAVLARLNKPGEYQLLQKEIEKLGRTDNAPWLEKLKAYLASPVGKDACKRLKEKDWFPKDWLP
jgi:CRISPR type III-B/RAMP module RAMP protein Cmr6